MVIYHIPFLILSRHESCGVLWASIKLLVTAPHFHFWQDLCFEGNLHTIPYQSYFIYHPTTICLFQTKLLCGSTCDLFGKFRSANKSTTGLVMIHWPPAVRGRYRCRAAPSGRSFDAPRPRPPSGARRRDASRLVWEAAVVF